MLASIAEVKADGNKVVFTLSGPNGDFPYLTREDSLASLAYAAERERLTVAASA